MKHRITQYVEIKASPQHVYDLLTSSDQFSQMTSGAPAEIDPAPGGTFSCFGGMILGRNIECLPAKRLVQAWRAKNWTQGVYSIVSFQLEATADGTRITMDHVGFPDDQGEHLEKGWHANYWDPMKKMSG